jgi:hypothetical protein
MKEEGHKKHGDRTEIVETTIIPQQPEQPHHNFTQPKTGSMNVSVGEPQVVSSQPFISYDKPVSTDSGIDHHGTTVKKIIDKTTIEHHENKKEKLKEKTKDASQKILGFIPNPFSHKQEETQPQIEATGPQTTITTTTTVPAQNLVSSGIPTNEIPQNVIPSSQNLPQGDLPYTTKTVTEYPSTGRSHLSCDKKTM